MQKSWVFLIAFLLLFVYLGGHFVVAEEGSGSDDDSDGEDDSDTDDNSDDESDSDEEEDESDDSGEDSEDDLDDSDEDSDDESEAEDDSDEDSDGNGIDDEDETQDENGISASTDEEVEIMKEDKGAKIRLVQFRYRVAEALARMDVVIAYLEEKGENVEELKGIAGELKLLGNEAAGVGTTNVDLAVEKFVSMKDEGIGLIKEFRDKARELLTEEDKELLREKFKEIKKTDIDRMKLEVKTLKRMLNAENVRKVLESAEDADADLVQRIKDGRISAQEAKEELRRRYESASEEERIKLKEEFKREVEERKDEVRMKIEKYVENREGIVKERVEVRAKELRKAASAYVKARAERLEVASSE